MPLAHAIIGPRITFYSGSTASGNGQLSRIGHNWSRFSGSALVNKGGSLQLKQFHIEELRRRLAALDQMKSHLEDSLHQLESTVARERHRGMDSVIARLAMPRILDSLEARRQNIEKTRLELDRDRERLDSELTEALEDLRSAELAETERRRRTAQATAAVAELRETEQFARRHLRRHAAR